MIHSKDHLTSDLSLVLNAAKPAKQINILYHLRLWQINEGYGVFVKYTWCNIIVFGIFKWRTLYQAVSDAQLVKQRKMVKKRDR